MRSTAVREQRRAIVVAGKIADVVAAATSKDMLSEMIPIDEIKKNDAKIAECEGGR